MTAIAPTVGRIVWFHPEGGTPNGDPLAAKIAAVNEDGTINLGVLDHNGVPYAKTNVFLRQDGEANPLASTGGWAQWMPYQVGQAAKALATAPGGAAVADTAVHEKVAALEKSVGDKFSDLGQWLQRIVGEFHDRILTLETPLTAKNTPPAPPPAPDASGPSPTEIAAASAAAANPAPATANSV